MDSIDILVNEHMHIKKVLAAIKSDCEELAEGRDVNVEFYRNVIDFVRNFADKYHHKKEENKLFNIMSDVNPNLKSGPIMGMLLEHDIGRSYIKNLDEAISEYEKGNKKQKAYIIANALSYAVHLDKHIEKENTNIYVTARRILPKSTQESMTKEFQEIENNAENKKTREKYITFANNI